ncbi:MAG TPA: ATP-binding protein [Thermodesulfovibrionales bacterium]|nr:ATP-binding protein [Thermodesulfovibrionales bacterium]
MQNEELRRAQTELEASRGRYADLYDFAPTGYFTFDKDGLIREANLTVSNLLGIDKRFLIGKPFSLFVMSDDKDIFVKHMAEVLSKEALQPCEVRVRRKDKSVFYAQLLSIAVEDEKGRLTLCRSAVSDITEGKRVEAALRESEKRYHSLFENMFEGFAYCKMLFDDHGRPLDFVYLDVNSAFGKLTGLKNVVGKRVTEVIPGIKESSPELFEIYSRVALSGQQEKFEIKVKPLGSWFSISAYSMERGYFVAVFDNITERKQAEELVQKLNENLNQGNAELAATNRELEAANKELDAFSYSVSHDLRAPLRHMSGFVGLLQKRLVDHPDEKTHLYADAIAGAAKKMGRLIDDLLEFSRMGRTEMQKKRVNLNTLIKGAVREIQEELKERKIRWEIDELPDVLGDRSLLRLAVVNLLSNAVKFTRTRPQAEIKIECKDEEDKFTCSVTDNGVGFDMQYADKLFGVFQRLHTQDEFEGIGIGLANVQRIISRHGGRIWAEGAVGQGATFYFTLPKTKEI